MLCDKCKQRTATIYYTESVDGQLIEHHLCERCAIEYAGFDISEDSEITIGDVLSAILSKFHIQSDSIKQISEVQQDDDVSQDQDEKSVLKCDNCNMTYEQFLKEGRLGCPKCYHSFEKIVMRTLRTIQKADTHIGKVPVGFQSLTEKIIESMTEVDKKRILLQEAVEKEDFERAVELREEIHKLQNSGTLVVKENRKDPFNKEEVNHV